jgi:hypothetical protein
MPEQILLNFIKKCRKEGFSDLEIKEEIKSKGWPEEKINQAFLILQPKAQYKNQITLFLNDDMINILEKRAKKNLFTLSEQVEDILRRSCVRKNKPKQEKIDDKLLLCFSRPQKGTLK